MLRVKIKNFQSIKEAEIEICGYTVVVGVSNIGKSSLTRAIRGAIQNRSGTFFIRRGSKFCAVRLDIDGKEILWEKGVGRNKYVIDGEVYEGLGRANVPDELVNIGFREIQIGEKKLNIQAPDQFSPLFLLNEVGSVNSEVISKAGRLDVINKALKLCLKDLRKSKDRLKVKEEDYRNIKGEEQKFKNLGKILSEVEEIKKSALQIEELQIEVDWISLHEGELISRKEGIENLEKITFSEIPQYNLNGLAIKYEEVKVFEDSFSKLNEEVNSLEKSQGAIVPSLDFLAEAESLAEVQNFSLRIKNSSKKVDLLKKSATIQVPGIKDVEEVFSEVQSLVSLDEKIRKSGERYKDLKKELTRVGEEVEKANIAEQDFKKKIKVCPLCERPF